MAQSWEYCEIVGAFKNSIKVLSRQRYPTLSCLAPVLQDLKDKLIVKFNDSSVLKATKSAVKKNFDDRYQHVYM